MAEDVVNELEKKIALYETVKKRQPAETGDYASKVSAFKPPQQYLLPARLLTAFVTPT